MGRLPAIRHGGTRAIVAALAPHHHVLAFGGAHLAAWFAPRARSVLVMEDDAARHARWRDRLSRLDNADCRLATRHGRYLAVPEMRTFDLILIDGPRRMACARLAVARRADGGAIYLDDADSPAHTAAGDVPAARRFLIAHAQAAGLPVREFAGFVPTRLRFARGLMIG